MSKLLSTSPQAAPTAEAACISEPSAEAGEKLPKPEFNKLFSSRQRTKFPVNFLHVGIIPSSPSEVFFELSITVSLYFVSQLVSQS